MHLEHPALLVLTACLLLAAIVVALARRPGPALSVALPPWAQPLAAPWRARLLWLPPALGAAAALMAALAAAGPHLTKVQEPDPRMARDIVLALDTSESMRALDFALEGRPASRMEAALAFAARFIALRQGDRVGVVAFGSRAVTQCPLTYDRAVAQMLLSYVEPEILGKRTALGDAIALCAARLPQGGAAVLITDGENTAGQIAPLEAARATASRGVRIYSVGVGSEGPAPVPTVLPSGGVRIQMKDYPLDEATLRQVAQATGGAYFRAQDAQSLRDVFAEIDKLEKKEGPPTRPLPAGGLSDALAAAACVALAAQLILSATLLRAAPCPV